MIFSTNIDGLVVEYLMTAYGWDLVAYEATNPMKIDDFFLSKSDVYFPNDTFTGEGVLSLFNETGYDLSIPVIGYYYFHGADPTSCKSLSLIHAKYGEAFANLLLQKLHISAPRNLREIVEEIYAEKFLFVSRVQIENQSG